MAVLKARISGQWVPITTAPANLIDPMRFRNPRPALTDFEPGDVIEYYGAYWVWWDSTPPAAWPLSSSNWRLLGGIPWISVGQWNAWTTAETGDQAWVTPTGGTQPAAVERRLMTKKATGWGYADQTEFVTALTTVQSVTSATVVVPLTSYTLLAPAMVRTYCSIYAGRVSGTGQYSIDLENLSGTPGQRRIARGGLDATRTELNLVGESTYWHEAGAHSVQAVLRRTSGDIAVNTFLGLHNMTISW